MLSKSNKAADSINPKVNKYYPRGYTNLELKNVGCKNVSC